MAEGEVGAEGAGKEREGLGVAGAGLETGGRKGAAAPDLATTHLGGGQGCGGVGSCGR